MPRLLARLAAAAALLLCGALAERTFANSSYQVLKYLATPLKGDPKREVRLQSVTFPPGSGNGFHRHPGDQWALIQEGEVTLTIQGQPPRTLKAGESVYLPRGTIHKNQNLSDKPARSVEVSILDINQKPAESVE